MKLYLPTLTLALALGVTLPAAAQVDQAAELKMLENDAKGGQPEAARRLRGTRESARVPAWMVVTWRSTGFRWTASTNKGAGYIFRNVPD